MSIQDYISLVIALAAIIGIFLSVVSNLQIKKQRELQYLPFIRLSSFNKNLSLNTYETILKVENIGSGISKNMNAYTSFSKSDDFFEGVTFGAIPLEVLSPEESQDLKVENENFATSAIMSLSNSSYYHFVITYEDIFHNLYMTKCFFIDTKEGFDFYNFSEPISLSYFGKKRFFRKISKINRK